ncbi:hypothetical protein HUA74_30150 [Myxococcus sp. CA051A]|uniref:Lipoprotein n=1 Tax=Myxococcus llanfairpwllgwyngyllgogerychwyrndrobwllllantysiliogogogochensis TaxID=2590453 RepID=A0A540X830_9BACT|nr:MULTISPECIES: hypothetical protein [Myxococcus]NTX06325.1 hypothetical protein [Myxococcus sp. CA040A]NTX09583.1 hypothetical protein [Myxococcus sp. CA056]NTX34947.1 hypothetical protein [Myxococcus sp. CA033]NTX54839.1 hypothetical protein [Myxococcus sp. CA039A]NTX64924.1 hypothetical protein [Myxococcus sp. CA051A]
MRTRVFVTLAALLLACGPDFELQSEIRRVRVLGIRAEPPELVLDPDTGALPGPMTFSALAVTPDARPVTVSYALCRFNGNPYDGRCPGVNGVALPDGMLSLQDPNVQVVLQEALVAANPNGGGTPNPDDPRTREALEKGIPLFVGYEASDGSGTPEGTERGVRQVLVRSTTAPNQNPAVADILWNDATLTGPLPLDAEVVFRPVLTEGSLELYTAEDGPRTEQVFYSWFATGDGEVKEFRSQEPVDNRPGDPTSKYETPATPQRITVYVVARDGRGGVGWLSRDVDVGP